MKAILVIDVPNDFNLDGAYSNCIVYEGGKHRMWNRIAYVKPMPKRKPVSYHDDLFGDVEKDYTNIGWNQCLEEIEK